MFGLIGGHFLLGAVLALRFRVGALVPVCVMILAVSGWRAYSVDLGSGLLWASIAIGSAQLGYLAGVLARALYRRRARARGTAPV